MQEFEVEDEFGVPTLHQRYTHLIFTTIYQQVSSPTMPPVRRLHPEIVLNLDLVLSANYAELRRSLVARLRSCRRGGRLACTSET